MCVPPSVAAAVWDNISLLLVFNMVAAITIQTWVGMVANVAWLSAVTDRFAVVAGSGILDWAAIGIGIVRYQCVAGGRSSVLPVTAVVAVLR